MRKGFLAALTLSTSLTSQANDYYFTPVFNASERYYSNLFLSSNPQQDNWITALSPGVNFGLRHENGILNSNFTWNQLFYTNQSELNIAEQLFSIGYQRNTERLLWGINGYFNHQASLNTFGTLAGTVFTNIMAKQLNLAPTITYALTELSSMSFDYSYYKTTYEKNQNPYLTDYDYHLASGTFNHLYTEYDKLNATLSFSLYKSQGKTLELVPSQTTYNTVAYVGWQHSFSEQLVTYLSVGMNYSRSDSQQFDPQLLLIGYNSQGLPVYFDPIAGLTLQQQYNVVDTTNTGLGSVFRASIQKSFERGSVALLGSQNQTPTSQGLQTQTQLNLNSSYTLSERWTSGFSANYSLYEFDGAQTRFFNGAQSNFFNSNRSYATFSPSINWKWTPEINVGFSYTFRQQDITDSNSTSYDNNVQLQFSYQPQINNQVK